MGEVGTDSAEAVEDGDSGGVERSGHAKRGRHTNRGFATALHRAPRTYPVQYRCRCTRATGGSDSVSHPPDPPHARGRGKGRPPTAGRRGGGDSGRHRLTGVRPHRRQEQGVAVKGDEGEKRWGRRCYTPATAWRRRGRRWLCAGHAPRTMTTWRLGGVQSAASTSPSPTPPAEALCSARRAGPPRCDEAPGAAAPAKRTRPAGEKQGRRGGGGGVLGDCAAAAAWPTGCAVGCHCHGCECEAVRSRPGVVARCRPEGDAASPRARGPLGVPNLGADHPLPQQRPMRTGLRSNRRDMYHVRI